MKMMMNCSLVWMAMIFAAGSAQAVPLCKDYWEARKAGQDWQMHPPLSQYDESCASNLVIAKDWNGNCGVHVAASGGYPSMPGGNSKHVQISWFNCQVGGTELSFGDFVEGSIEEQCVTSCEACATGPYVKCAEVFKPANQ